MKKFGLLEKLCFIFGFTGVLFSITVSIIAEKSFTWQLITLMWMLSAFFSELRIKQLEEKK